jgi:hypothetical protein
VEFASHCLIKFSCHVASQSADLFEGYATDSKFITGEIYGEPASRRLSAAHFSKPPPRSGPQQSKLSRRQRDCFSVEGIN